MPSRSAPPPRPPATGLRRSVEKRSGPLLAFLSQQPKLLMPVVSLVLLIAGLALKGVAGAICLALLTLIVGWLAYLSWPAVEGRARLVRLLSVALLVVLVVQHLV